MKLNNLVPDEVSPICSFSTSLDATMRRYRISAKQLSVEAKVAENRISEFRRGKSDISSKALSRLLDGMETIAPGAKAYFCQLMSGKQTPSSFKESLLEIIRIAEEEELLDAMAEITLKVPYLSKFSDMFSP